MNAQPLASIINSPHSRFLTTPFLQVIEVDRAADARAKILASGAGALGNMVALESLRPYVTRLRNETDISRGVACLALQSMDFN